MKYDVFAKKLGKQLATIRQEMQLTQAQLARKSGLSL
jgi:transcriptional regulator with XRE-family HTH domain